MEDKPSWIEILLDKGIEFVRTGIELLKLKAIDRISEAISSIIARLIAGVVLFAALMFASAGLALWLGELLGKSWYGFLIVAGFYLIVGLIMFFMLRKQIKKRIGNYLKSNLTIR